MHPILQGVGQKILDLRLPDDTYLVPQADLDTAVTAGQRSAQITHRPGPLIPNRGLVNWDNGEDGRTPVADAPQKRESGRISFGLPLTAPHDEGERLWSNLYVISRRAMIDVGDMVDGGAPIVLIEGEGRDSTLHSGSMLGGVYEQHLRVRIIVGWALAPPTGWAQPPNAWILGKDQATDVALRAIEQAVMADRTLGGQCLDLDDPATSLSPDLPEEYDLPLIGATLTIMPWGTYDA